MVKQQACGGGWRPRSDSLATILTSRSRELISQPLDISPPSRGAPGIQTYGFHSPVPCEHVWLQSFIALSPPIATSVCMPLDPVVWGSCSSQHASTLFLPLFPASCQLCRLYSFTKTLVRFNFFLEPMITKLGVRGPEF